MLIGSQIDCSVPVSQGEFAMLVTIERVTHGTCAWCRSQTDDGVQVTFKDGFAAFLCRKDFWAALKARAAESPRDREQQPKSAKGQPS